MSYDNTENSQFSVKLLLSDTQFSCLQEKDPKIRSLHEKVCGGLYKEFFFIKNDILYRSIMDNGHKFNAAVIHEDLTDTINLATMVTRGLMLQSNGVTLGKE